MKNKKGFTLAEMLIVVAIIGVLVAIVTPVLTKNLEKSREATDMANIKTAFESAVYSIMDSSSLPTIGWVTGGGNAYYNKSMQLGQVYYCSSGNKPYNVVIELHQKQANWQTISGEKLKIDNLEVDISKLNVSAGKKYLVIKVKEDGTGSAEVLAKN